MPSHGTTFGSTCFATSCTTKRLRSTIQNNFTGYGDLRVLSYVAMVATPKQWIPSINVSTDDIFLYIDLKHVFCVMLSLFIWAYTKQTKNEMKWSWAGHINRLKDDRWTSRVTTWIPYDKKIRQGRPAKRWRDDLDKY